MWLFFIKDDDKYSVENIHSNLFNDSSVQTMQAVKKNIRKRKYSSVVFERQIKVRNSSKLEMVDRRPFLGML